MTPRQIEQSATLVRQVDCPRCHQQCGWCGDYRFMHGKLNLPGIRRKCTLTEVMPEGDACPICHGSRRVTATTTFTAPDLGDVAPEKFPDDGAYL